MAVAFMSVVQDALDRAGLNGTEPGIKAGMKAIVDAFQAHDLSGVKRACDALAEAIERKAKPASPGECGAPGDVIRDATA